MGLLMKAEPEFLLIPAGARYRLLVLCELKGQSVCSLTSQALTVTEFPPQLEPEFPFSQRESATSTVFLDILSSLCVQPAQRFMQILYMLQPLTGIYYVKDKYTVIFHVWLAAFSTWS